ncbi:transcription termination/antitermination protein NusG [Leuconostoc citreum]|jgi:transcriptional antiterminator NusG|uniref:Transcription termination/antitermination protein NusG n=3 Tax=Lactobacillaceae TaxID=33958 RepID=B1MVU5_LEUCK|nr:transcription termination/antitermination protein NusG [Leuconostoc citreum]ACA83349.1 Transcription termination/antitermination factor NusG [Leuconostoc citreum KM20]QOG10076.1 transcription termination/antitermination protein NusG [Leuconostoc sp. LN180020]CCF23751.1 Transcription antitermination protein nusG [Leuconostoc citreum LBAE C10]CCF26049.1 Transcription antitermination protein nusG [Leuconostoc citreum LBAE C11]CCF27862.1 Transcription antitermination protein nusG [Leuconostoc c
MIIVKSINNMSENNETPITNTDDIEKSWFVVHTYSGYEHKVKANLESRTQTMGMSQQIFRILVPEQEVTTIQDGEAKTSVENDFPGYVLVEMATPQDYNMTDEAWYVVRNTPGVTGFLGSHGAGSKPNSLLPEEVDLLMKRMGMVTREVVDLDVEVGQVVKIIAGPFSGMEGTVTAIDSEKQTLEATVEVFGRETPTELDFADVDTVLDEA